MMNQFSVTGAVTEPIMSAFSQHQSMMSSTTLPVERYSFGNNARGAVTSAQSSTYLSSGPSCSQSGAANQYLGSNYHSHPPPPVYQACSMEYFRGVQPSANHQQPPMFASTCNSMADSYSSSKLKMSQSNDYQGDISEHQSVTSDYNNNNNTALSRANSSNLGHLAPNNSLYRSDNDRSKHGTRVSTNNSLNNRREVKEEVDEHEIHLNTNGEEDNDDDQEEEEEDDDEDEDDDDDDSMDAEAEDEVDQCHARTIYLSANCVLHSYLRTDIVSAINEHFQRSFALFFNVRPFETNGQQKGAPTYTTKQSDCCLPSTQNYFKSADGIYAKDNLTTSDQQQLVGKFSTRDRCLSSGGSVTDPSQSSPIDPEEDKTCSAPSGKSVTTGAPVQRCCSRSSSTNSSSNASITANVRASCIEGHTSTEDHSGQSEVKLGDEPVSGDKCRTGSRHSPDDSYLRQRYHQHHKRYEVRRRRYLKRLQLLHTPMIKRKFPPSFWKFNARFSCYYYASLYGPSGSNSSGPNYSTYGPYSIPNCSYTRAQSSHSYSAQSMSSPQQVPTMDHSTNQLSGSYLTSSAAQSMYEYDNVRTLIKSEENGPCSQYPRPLSLSVSMTIGASTTTTSTTTAAASTLPSMSTSSSSTSAAAAAAAAALATLNNDLTLDMSIHISPSITLTAPPNAPTAYLGSVGRPIGSCSGTNASVPSAPSEPNTSTPSLYHASNHSNYLGLSFNSDSYYYHSHHQYSSKLNNSVQPSPTDYHPQSYASIYASRGPPGTSSSNSAPNAETWRPHYPSHYQTHFSQMVAQMQQHNGTRSTTYYPSIEGQYSDKTLPVNEHAHAEHNYPLETGTACPTDAASGYSVPYQTPNDTVNFGTTLSSTAPFIAVASAVKSYQGVVAHSSRESKQSGNSSTSSQQQQQQQNPSSGLYLSQ